MKIIKVEDAVGSILSHDVTQIIPGEFKGRLFKKGHIIKEEDIEKLLSIGKEHVYVWEPVEGQLHENDAATRISNLVVGEGIKLSDEIKEGKVDFFADRDGVLKIDKINLERGFYSKESKLNNVNKNIQIINSSDLPDKENGNVILAAHCGNSRVAFFNKLPNLELGDIATIYYQGREYSYQLVDNYEIEKSGQANIKRNRDKNVLTLITCKHKTNKQLIFIFELINIE